MPDTLTDHISTRDALWGQRPKPDAPATLGQWLAFEAEDFDRAAELAGRFVDRLDGADALALLTGTDGDRLCVRENFLEWVEKNW